ncbi:hypothetical protein ACSBR1_008236 [Camellia fascicularis]
MQGERTFQIKSFQPKHACRRSYNNHLVNSTYLAHKYMDKLRDDPNIKVGPMQKTVWRKSMVDVSRPQLYRAKKKKAREVIEGDQKVQYAKVYDYCETVRLHNPNSVMQVVVDRPNEDMLRPNFELPPVFQRLYVGFAARRTGFVGGCRPIIGLDGCHLKGIYGGQLLYALGSNGNNNYFPISWTVVETESKDSWVWFLRQLMDDIGSVDDMG